MIYLKTELGQAALLTRSLELTPRQRSAFIMFDGKRSAAEVLAATSGLGITEKDVSHMVEYGLLVAATGAAPTTAGAESNTPVAPVALGVAPLPTAPAQAAPVRPTLSAQAHYSKAYPIATRLTAALGLRGFLLHLAVEAATDLSKLQELAPKIRQAVGAEKFKELESALYE